MNRITITFAILLSAAVTLGVERASSDAPIISSSSRSAREPAALDSIVWPTLSSGTAVCSSATQQWGFTIGQPIVGDVSFGTTTLELGFWHGFGCCRTRGDVDHSGGPIDISDLVYLVDYMFTGGPPPLCVDEANIDGVGSIDISDLVYLVDFMFTGGPTPLGC